ncbi:hypothetical protein Adt_13034 [Abeliophyllum distichum]|uniref:Uncharacterized protein n=1 Tax=Abeliophyllum distichum TaxID=126358 RepID=A0ABD1TVN4_9LAMI
MCMKDHGCAPGWWIVSRAGKCISRATHFLGKRQCRRGRRNVLEGSNRVWQLEKKRRKSPGNRGGSYVVAGNTWQSTTNPLPSKTPFAKIIPMPPAFFTTPSITDNT